MRPKEIMVVAGEASGDMLAAELVGSLRDELTRNEIAYTDDPQPLRTGLEPRFFGAGGPRMKAAGVELAFDLTEHSVIGFSGVIRKYFEFRRLLHRLYRLALQRQPDVIVGVDFSLFNRKLAQAIRRQVRGQNDWFHHWKPRLVQYVSPQVWASRESRAYELARNYDLILSIFPFEKQWYATRVPQLAVKFVGNPMVDRYAKLSATARIPEGSPTVVLLPGSRAGELKRHLPVLRDTLARMRAVKPGLRARMVLPNDLFAEQARSAMKPGTVEVQVGGVDQALAGASIAIAKTGTIALECAFFGVPTVTFYKTSWANYQIGKRVVKVSTLTMPNLLAGENVFPEFVQDTATGENIAKAALELLENTARREEIQGKLAKVIASLGQPGASRRAAREIVELLPQGRARALRAQ